MAEFADAELRKLHDYTASREYRVFTATLARRQEEAAKWRSMAEDAIRRARAAGRAGGGGTTTPAARRATAAAEDMSRQYGELEKMNAADEARLAEARAAADGWLSSAATAYACCLRAGAGRFLRAAFRLVALWLRHAPARADMNAVLYDRSAGGLQLPSAALLPLSYQLTCRLAGGAAGDAKEVALQRALSGVVGALAADHPHHLVWQLLSVANHDRSPPPHQRRATNFVGSPEKAARARALLAAMRGVHPQVVAEAHTLSEAYIQIAEMPKSPPAAAAAAGGRGGKDPNAVVITNTKLAAILNLTHTVVPTLPLSLHGTPLYGSELVTVANFSRAAQLLGGVNQPRRVTCRGSDGARYYQIVKGHDDLRQDAVMEQFFGLVNALLAADGEAAARRLAVRTYRVVPLTPVAGVLQFVAGTTPLFQWLAGDEGGGAHGRYSPGGATYIQAMQHMRRVEKLPLATQAKQLRGVYAIFPPVMRHFVTERWPSPPDWFDRRLAYARSLAVNSIVGYVAGIGDRHSSNILLDTHTAELVHIDLGITFDQGKLLRTPERVPFRMTRDLVDGLGVLGTDGAFRRCAEVTMRVMRESADALLTVIEVFLHDPLFHWASAPAKKLRGVHEREALSVPNHVALLMEEATSVENLAPMYIGWMMFL
ncbi:hypothetical protein I4F81_011500 [Pyropia yezoensis]|uniref:Uncharacterized protein n=1 Tax=Pyropia yezoensis TaxID=2788 RepID=A0ACC3CG03_PYRYE|nr:hypothetical protein I4F81_011500 [Neopyropia yezoensis]